MQHFDFFRVIICAKNLTEMTFQKLLLKCAQKDENAYIQLYRLYYIEVYNSCMRIVHNAEDAEEIMQDAFLKAFEHIAEFQGDEKHLGAYIRKIAVNLSLDLLRKKKKSFFVTLEDWSMEDDFEEEPEEEICFSIEKIKEKMEQLPSGYRLVLTLHLLENMEFKNIAEQMQIQSSTVRSQYVRALYRLRHLLQNEI